MAGRARAKALLDALEARTRQSFEVEEAISDDPHTTLDYVADWIESGNTLKELAGTLTTELGHEVTYARIMATLREQHGAELTDRTLETSRTRASHSLAETALELVDAPADSNVDVSRAASRARTRQWMAERYNPSKYGQAKGVSVSVTVGSLHLDALKQVNAMMTVGVTGTPQAALQSGPHNTGVHAAIEGEVVAVHDVTETA